MTVKKISRVAMALVAAVLAGHSARSQTVVNPSGQKIVLAGQAAPAVETRPLNDRQKALADEADRLLSLATELKEQVDMTSKNILSIKVVRKAEEIELYARRLKVEARK